MPSSMYLKMASAACGNAQWALSGCERVRPCARNTLDRLHFRCARSSLRARDNKAGIQKSIERATGVGLGAKQVEGEYYATLLCWSGLGRHEQKRGERRRR